MTGAVAMEATTIRKIQIWILPFIFLLYVVAYVDRINLGFAALTMNRELGITSRQFGLLTGVFFISARSSRSIAGRTARCGRTSCQKSE